MIFFSNNGINLYKKGFISNYIFFVMIYNFLFEFYLFVFFDFFVLISVLMGLCLIMFSIICVVKRFRKYNFFFLRCLLIVNIYGIVIKIKYIINILILNMFLIIFK